LISNAWQYRSYTYTIGASSPPGAPTSAQPLEQTQDHYVYNDNKPQTWTYVLLCGDGTECGDASRIVDGTLSVGADISAALASVDNVHPARFQVTFKANYNASPVTRDLTFSYTSANPPHAAFPITIPQALHVYDATPHIDFIQQYPPASPGGPFWITLYGNNFGPSAASGAVKVCSHSAPDACKDHTANEISVSTSAPPYSYWSNGQVNVLLTPAQNTAGVYDVQLISGGASPGLGFQPAPQSQT